MDKYETVLVKEFKGLMLKRVIANHYTCRTFDGRVILEYDDLMSTPLIGAFAFDKTSEGHSFWMEKAYKEI